MKTPILGSAYVTRSVNAADARMVNLFPEIIPEGGKEPAFLQRCPGLKFEQSIGVGPIRALWSRQGNGGVFYVVSGDAFYMLTSLTATPTYIGKVGGVGPVSIADNGTQIFLATNPSGYIYNADTGAFGAIPDTDFPGAVTVTYLDGYFVFNEPDSQRFWVTSLLDGTTIDPLDFASAEGAPDGLVAVYADHRELWLFGTDTTEVWYNAGNSDFPFSRIQGAFNELGCAAAFSVAKMDNQVYWLGRDARGGAIVYRAAGYMGQRVSTHAVEWRMQEYANITDAVGFTYQQDGHSFYVLNFPSANATWVFDTATNAWHERASFDHGQFKRHRANNMCNFNDNIVVGDYQNGNIYTFDLQKYADYDRPQKWLRSWRALPTGQNNLTRTAQHSLQLDCETGVGLITGQGDNPQVMLRWSDDGGHTWSNEHWVSMGAIGGYGARAIWRRLGMTTKIRDRVYEVSGTDPTRLYITGAELLLSETNA